ncbi:disease resistance protein RGA5-like [Hordeum vulgare subsp. vulgare]|uniref:RGH1 n=2 Tax=Hordeum vulgare subsp. vulgare TaxID=112509 RepID=A0A287MQV0_HORVV|nr:disease resistance protein RGA5-like [Hordeum vulgare subsp. vulgare]
MERIMVSAATGVMNSLLTKLMQLMSDEYKLQKAVKSKIGSLKLELSSINAFLKKLSDKDDLDPQTKEWRDQVREMAYEIEDCIDNYMHKLDRKPDKVGGIMGFIRKSIGKVKNMGTVHGISGQLKQLKIEIIQTSERWERLQWDEAAISGVSTTTTIDSRMPALYAKPSDLVGIDAKTHELIKLVTDMEEKRLKVVSIVGYGGLGKTTLAVQVYRHLQGQFDFQATVLMSRNFDMRRILRDILSQTKKKTYKSKKMESWGEDILIQELRKFLEDKRYFVVIDDIWEARNWEAIKCAFPDGKPGSRIMTTTRIISVAKSSCIHRRDHIHELSVLSEADSQCLFYRRAFDCENGCPHELKDVSIEIVRRCGGLPLAIITLASLLSTKSYTRHEWMIVRDSIGLGLMNNAEMEDMNKILSLSYIDLPSNLKTCLLYLSVFPEDCVITRVRLVRRWIAEGFIEAECGKTLEEQGESYFNELINRSLIQPIDIEYDGRARACRVHDMILDLIVSKAVDANFVRLINREDAVVSNLKVRRLSLVCGPQEFSTESLVVSQARSVSIFGCSQQLPPLSKFNALRVVDIEGPIENNYIVNFGGLHWLRYLRISASTVTELPEMIGQLQSLETLDLKQTAIRELPASIVQLQRLKHLVVQSVKLPAGTAKMQSLQELSELYVDDSCQVTSLLELRSLANLTSLDLVWRISDSHTEKRIFAESLVLSLCELGKSKLRFLKVTSGESDGSYDFMFDASSSIPHLLEELTLYPNCYISENPSWMSSMRDLTKLNIMVNPVTQEAVDIFGNLPVLQFLVLSSKVILSKGIIIESGTFKCLKVFRLYCRDIDIGLTFKARAMQRIEKLTLPFKAHEPQPVLCGNDFGIRHLCALKYLEARISCRGAAAWEVEELDAAIRDAASLLPSHPVTRILMYYTEKMINDKKEKKSATGKSLYSGECFGSMEDHSYHHPHLHHIVHSGEEDPNSCSIC